MIHPDDIERVRDVFDTSVRTGEPYEIDFRIVRPDGDVRLMRSRGTVVHNIEGQPVREIGTCQDITERARADLKRAALRERQGASTACCSPSASSPPA